MSEIRVTTLKDTSGANSSTTEQIASGRAKAWVNFNGASTVATRTSFNVNSITDNGTGSYTVNFSSSLSADYVTVIGGHNTGIGDGGWFSTGNVSGAYPTGVNTGSVQFNSFNTEGQYQDNAGIYVAVFR